MSLTPTGGGSRWSFGKSMHSGSLLPSFCSSSCSQGSTGSPSFCTTNSEGRSLRERRFTLALIGACAAVVLATAAANFVLDPQYVFRSEFLPRSRNYNLRYEKFLDYERDGSKVDGLLFGASRATFFDPAEFARLTGRRYIASFAVPA